MRSSKDILSHGGGVVGSHEGRQVPANTPQEGAMLLYGKDGCGESQVLCPGRKPGGSKCSYLHISGK